jgi:hypothetical protein
VPPYSPKCQVAEFSSDDHVQSQTLVRQRVLPTSVHWSDESILNQGEKSLGYYR